MKILKLATVAAVWTMATGATTASHFLERTTYYNQSMTQVVGQYQLNCDGSDAFWGVVSGYPIVEFGDC